MITNVIVGDGNILLCRNKEHQDVRKNNMQDMLYFPNKNSVTQSWFNKICLKILTDILVTVGFRKFSLS